MVHIMICVVHCCCIGFAVESVYKWPGKIRTLPIETIATPLTSVSLPALTQASTNADLVLNLVSSNSVLPAVPDGQLTLASVMAHTNDNAMVGNLCGALSPAPPPTVMLSCLSITT